MCVQQNIDEARQYAKSPGLAVFREEWKGNGDRIVNEGGTLFMVKSDGTKTLYTPTEADMQATDWSVDYIEYFNDLTTKPEPKNESASLG